MRNYLKQFSKNFISSTPCSSMFLTDKINWLLVQKFSKIWKNVLKIFSELRSLYIHIFTRDDNWCQIFAVIPFFWGYSKIVIFLFSFKFFEEKNYIGIFFWKTPPEIDVEHEYQIVGAIFQFYAATSPLIPPYLTHSACIIFQVHLGKFILHQKNTI